MSLFRISLVVVQPALSRVWVWWFDAMLLFLSLVVLSLYAAQYLNQACIDHSSAKTVTFRLLLMMAVNGSKWRLISHFITFSSSPSPLVAGIRMDKQTDLYRTNLWDVHGL